MTHYLNYRKFSLAQAPTNIRVLLTLFSALMTLALVVGIVNYWDKTGLTPAGVVAHYLGNEGQPLAAGREMTFQKTFRQLLDATHPHLFGQGVLLFILCHIVALTGLPERMKVGLYGVSFGALLFDAAMPWLIRYASPGLAPLQLVSTFLLFASFFVLLGVTIRDTWFVAVEETAPAGGREKESVWPDRPGQATGSGGEARPRRGRDGREKRRGRRDGAPGGAPRPEGARPEGGRSAAARGPEVAAGEAPGNGRPTAGGPTPRDPGDGERRPRSRGGRRRGPRRGGEEGPAGARESIGARESVGAGESARAPAVATPASGQE